MRAVILAGGRGTRLAPYTTLFPKPLVPLGERPILEIILRQLIRSGFTDITLSVGHLAELIQAYFSQGAIADLPGLRLAYVRETMPLGTAGPLAEIDGLDETFFVMNGDVLTTLDFQRLVEYHRQQGALLTVAAHRRRIPIDLGVMECNDGFLVEYKEKPEIEYLASMGIYVYEPAVLSYIERGKHLDLPELIEKLMAAGERVAALVSDDYWLDIGRQDDYAQAQEEFERRKHEFLPAEDA